MKNVILIAPPATGKGTISKNLEENYGYKHISTGDLLRKIALSDTEMGRDIKNKMENGEFISDEIIFELVEKEIIELKNNPFILDGIPRNLEQAKFLTNLLEKNNVDNYLVINMEIDSQNLQKRTTGRRICTCGSIYNIYFDELKPKIENTCDVCQKNLIQRSDDNEETFKKRYNDFLEKTLPVIKFYESINKLAIVDANKSTKEIMQDVINFLKEE